LSVPFAFAVWLTATANNNNSSENHTAKANGTDKADSNHQGKW